MLIDTKVNCQFLTGYVPDIGNIKIKSSFKKQSAKQFMSMCDESGASSTSEEIKKTESTKKFRIECAQQLFRRNGFQSLWSSGESRRGCLQWLRILSLRPESTALLLLWYLPSVLFRPESPIFLLLWLLYVRNVESTIANSHWVQTWICSINFWRETVGSYAEMSLEHRVSGYFGCKLFCNVLFI